MIAIWPISTARHTNDKRIVLEITRVAITQASISGSGVLAGPDAVLSILRARERERRRCARISAIAEHDEGSTLFIPIVLTSCGGVRPSAQKYLKHIYSRAREERPRRFFRQLAEAPQQGDGRWGMGAPRQLKQNVPHGTRFTLPRTRTCASAWLVPQRTRRSRTTFF